MAWKKTKGKKVYIREASISVHAIAGGYNRKFCNAKSVKVNQKKVTLRKGQASAIKATVVGVRSDREVLHHKRRIRYYSTDRNVARVSVNGVIHAVGTGNCTIYAIANNGVKTGVKVKVK